MAVRARVMVAVTVAACGAPANHATSEPTAVKFAATTRSPTTSSAATSSATTSSATTSSAATASPATASIAASPTATPAQRPSSVERFVVALQSNQSLYGVGRACDEWRVGPDDRAPSNPDRWLVQGRISAALPDKGRMYSFTYALERVPETLRMTIVGRGSWSPAPGVTFEVPGKPGWGTIGTGTYCLARVDVRPHPDREDAVLVGGETWYLTREACQQAHSRLLAVLSCGDMPKK